MLSPFNLRALNALNDAGTPISVPSNPEQAVLQLQLTSLRKALKEDRTTQPLKVRSILFTRPLTI